MFLLGVGEALRLKGAQGTDDTETGVARLDDIVDVTELGSLVGVGELLGVFIHLLGDKLLMYEAMKMENNLLAEADGTITAINCRQGDNVLQGDTLIVIG